MSKVLVDTNVLIYTKDRSSTFHLKAINILNRSEELFITTKNLTEYYAVVTKGSQPLLSPIAALQDINEFISYFKLPLSK
ncbi:MAG: PIN domain-containing protein [Flammeovirgaceae bacterium]|nr:PIN domain-containing protein [Flammeovirgaceae bacterium]